MAMFALLLPVFLGLGAIVVGVGNWYTHGKHLQTKVDASAFAGGSVWSVPCVPDTDEKIETAARTYVGAHMKADNTAFLGTSLNPQVGGVDSSKIHVVLNGSNWYDDDSNPFPAELDDPSNASICNAMTLDVKATEDNSFPLLSLIPLFPDIKRKARLQIEEVEGINGLLPVAVRVPEPLSVAAVFYNESPPGNVLGARYFRKDSNIFGLPAGLGGWTTLDPADASSWVGFTPSAKTGVAIATSFRPACGAPGATPPCFSIDTATYPTVNQLCNQGTNTQVAQCFYSTGNWPSQSIQSGLHFIRGYPTGDAGGGPPDLRGAYVESDNCQANGYFNSGPNSACQARLTVELDLGSVVEDTPPTPPDEPVETRVPSNVEVRYKLVRADGTSFCNFGPNCALETSSPGGPLVSFATQGSASSPHLPLTARSLGNAVAIEVRLKGSSATPNPGGCGPDESFSDNCRWFYTGNGLFGTSVPPTNAQILNAPIQRSFMGDINRSGPVNWLRLTADPDCDGDPGTGASFVVDLDAASRPTGAPTCFYMDMGLKGGAARDQDEPPIIFNEGTGSSQMGAVDCDPAINQGQVLVIGVMQGCGPFYRANGFDTNPLCPAPNDLFTLPNPGPPFDDWPPLECLKTRPTSQMSQISSGLQGRILGNPMGNPPCPDDDASSFVPGRNYWHRENNQYKNDPNDPNVGANFKWDGDTPGDTPPATDDDVPNNLRQDDPRLVTLFFSTYNSFTASGQNTYPVTGFGSFYITGWGRISGSGTVTIEDPCSDGNSSGIPGAGNLPPSDTDLSGGSTGGRVVWGHFVNNVVPTPNATPSGKLCAPATSLQPCVPVLVE